MHIYHAHSKGSYGGGLRGKSGGNAAGWAPESIASPALKQKFMPLDTSAQVFGWDPL